MEELLGLLVVLIVWGCVACESGILRAVLCTSAIALFLGISTHSTRSAFVSARKAAADRLPQTPNPKHEKPGSGRATRARSDDAREDEDDDDGGDGGDHLPRTANPRTKNALDAVASAKGAKAPEIPRGSINDFAYTFEGQRARLDERIFRPEPRRQSSEARARVLDAMYQELLESSHKNDPAMRPIGGDGCEIMRGRAGPRPV